ncbi:MAG: 5'-methylthioadenosine/adenosylhomocysteine nucleosidase [Treponema sp.]|nr:5'-methylthioadenosine/adenosylhomocysteine nucleosidase [Treponema sp.]
MKIGIIGAMEVEVRSLCAKLEDCQKYEYGNLTFFAGKLSGKELVVVKSGVGKVNAALCVQMLSDKFNVDKIINTGIAGAAGKGLGVFDFVVSTEACYHDLDVRIFGYEIGQVPGMDRFFKADPVMVEKAVESFKESKFAGQHKIQTGRVASGDQFIADKAVKESIISNFAPACVEMEGAAIAHACTVNKIPFVIIRCMSDCADDSATSTYDFNEDTCAQMSAEFVSKLIEKL